MKIANNPWLISEKALDVMADVARRTAPKGYKINGRLKEEAIKSKCFDVLTCEGMCICERHVPCPNYCTKHGWHGCGLYVKS